MCKWLSRGKAWKIKIHINKGDWTMCSEVLRDQFHATWWKPFIYNTILYQHLNKSELIPLTSAAFYLTIFKLKKSEKSGGVRWLPWNSWDRQPYKLKAELSKVSWVSASNNNFLCCFGISVIQTWGLFKPYFVVLLPLS